MPDKCAHRWRVAELLDPATGRYPAACSLCGVDRTFPPDPQRELGQVRDTLADRRSVSRALRSGRFGDDFPAAPDHRWSHQDRD